MKVDCLSQSLRLPRTQERFAENLLVFQAVAACAIEFGTKS